MQDLTRQIFKEYAFFFLIDIQRNPPNVAALQSFDQGFGMNKAAAANVDENDSGFHLGQAFGIDDAIGLGRQRGMQGNQVTLFYENAHFHILNSVFGGPLLVRVRVESKHTHLKSSQYFTHDSPRFAGTDKASRLSV